MVTLSSSRVVRLQMMTVLLDMLPLLLSLSSSITRNMFRNQGLRLYRPLCSDFLRRKLHLLHYPKKLFYAAPPRRRPAPHITSSGETQSRAPPPSPPPPFSATPPARECFLLARGADAFVPTADGRAPTFGVGRTPRTLRKGMFSRMNDVASHEFSTMCQLSWGSKISSTVFFHLKPTLWFVSHALFKLSLDFKNNYFGTTQYQECVRATKICHIDKAKKSTRPSALEICFPFIWFDL